MYNQFMKEAIKLAQEGMATSQGGPFGAVIVKDNFIIGRGCNKVIGINDPTAHAEVTAIRDACKTLNTFWLTDCHIYTTCEPCPMCLGAIYWARLGKIYFGVNRGDAANIGFDDNFFYEEMAKTIDERKIQMIECMKLEALKPFTDWQRKQDKISY